MKEYNMKGTSEKTISKTPSRWAVTESTNCNSGQEKSIIVPSANPTNNECSEAIQQRQERASFGMIELLDLKMRKPIHYYNIQ